MATFVKHEPCSKCGSRDNLARYDDGSAYCFGCGHTERSSKYVPRTVEAITKEKAHRLQCLALAWLALNNQFGSEYLIDCASVLIENGRIEIDYRKGIL